MGVLMEKNSDTWSRLHRESMKLEVNERVKSFSQLSLTYINNDFALS